MAYSNFTLTDVITRFGLTAFSNVRWTAGIPPVPPGPNLTATLAENVPLATQMHTEKARSELIVSQVLVEVRRQLGREISLFSGNLFPVSPADDLTGECDFLLSRSANQFALSAPVAAVVEAKRDSIPDGLGQCAAIMVAIQKFNAKAKTPVPDVYGCVTTGSLWRFLRLTGTALAIDDAEYAISDVPAVLGVFVSMFAPLRVA